MITERVKHIFCFIDFLHSNIENFNKQETLLAKISELRKIYHDLDPKTNFEHKFEREEIAEKGNKLMGIFHRECKNTINEKINELEITDLTNIGNDHFYHIGEFIILVETQKYDKEDVKLIIEAKEKYVSILENLKLSLDNFLPYGLVKDFNEILLDCFEPFLSLDDKLKINKSKEIQFNRHMVTIESLDIQGIRNAVNKLKGKSIEFEFDINNWLINDKNIFEFSQDISLSLLTIQAEILKQCKAQNTSKLNDFLKSEINISKLISGTNELSIERIFKDYLDLNIGSPELEIPMTVNVNILLGYLKVELFKIYLENTNNLFLHTEKYKEKFQSLQEEFINSNIDVDKSDFIRNELAKCRSLLKELEKPVYNEISILGDTENEFCSFKKQFLNTLDKRQSFLNLKLEEFKNLTESQKYEQTIKDIEYYKIFTTVLNKMYDEEFDYKPNLDYAKITIHIINEIKEKLFELQNNEQRSGFLKNVFRGFFDNGKDYHLYQVNKLKYIFKDLPLEEKEYSDDQFNFIYNCLLCLGDIVTTISEESLIYDIDFNDVILWAWRHSEKGKQNPYEVFIYHLKGNDKNRKDSNSEVTLNKTEQLKTKALILSESLYEYGFFKLNKLKQLSEKSQNILIQLLSDNKLPYAMAMFDYLDYFTYLEKNHFTTKYKLYIEVSKWFNSDKEGRAVKGNVNSLLKNSTENKSRYTAFKHKEKVIRDYEELK